MEGERASKLRRHTMRQRDARGLLEEASPFLGELRSAAVEEAALEDGSVIYFLDRVAQLARVGEVLHPTLTSPLLDRLPSVVVDMGAVPYVCNGADVMAPGIVEVRGEFQDGDVIVVRDVRHGKALALGRALAPSAELRNMKKGKALRNLHYVGDQLWRAYS